MPQPKSEIKGSLSLLGCVLAIVHAVDVCDLLALGDVPRSDEDGGLAGVDPAGVGRAAVVEEGADGQIVGVAQLDEAHLVAAHVLVHGQDRVRVAVLHVENRDGEKCILIGWLKIQNKSKSCVTPPPPNNVKKFRFSTCLYLEEAVQDNHNSDLCLAARQLVPEVPRPEKHSVQYDAQHQVLHALVARLKNSLFNAPFDCPRHWDFYIFHLPRVMRN